MSPFNTEAATILCCTREPVRLSNYPKSPLPRRGRVRVEMKRQGENDFSKGNNLFRDSFVIPSPLLNQTNCLAAIELQPQNL